MEPKFKVQLKIQKPVAEVFDAVVNPKKLSRYFTKTASGPLETGQTVMWSFPEVPNEFPIKVSQVVPNERIVLKWEASEGGYDTTVEMVFTSLEDGATMVQIGESGFANTPKGIEASNDNCGGWMHMMLCCKAYLLHGINLREGGAL